MGAIGGALGAGGFFIVSAGAFGAVTLTAPVWGPAGIAVGAVALAGAGLGYYNTTDINDPWQAYQVGITGGVGVGMAAGSAAAVLQELMAAAVAYGYAIPGQRMLESLRTPTANQGPLPPMWNSSYELRPPTRDSAVNWRWFDPDGGEWRYHDTDPWHGQAHWDYNPWDSWCSDWENWYGGDGFWLIRK